jgi:hypothetical protein
VFRSINYLQSRLTGTPWNFASDAVGAVNAKIDAAGARLDSILNLGQGMHTGRNDVFGERSETEMRDWRVPESLRFKRATNSDIERYFIHDRGEYILFLEEVVSFSDLPLGVQNHLRKHEKALKERAAYERGDCEWWKYTWPLHHEWYDRARILCPYLAQENRFALDTEREFLGLTDTTVLFDNGQPESLLYIVALLNSRLLTFRFRTIGKLKSGGIYEYFWNSISRLPIRRINFAIDSEARLHDEIVALAMRLQDAIPAQHEARDPYERARREREVAMLDVEIEQRVRVLYGVTSAEEALVEDELIETSLQEAV